MINEKAAIALTDKLTEVVDTAVGMNDIEERSRRLLWLHVDTNPDPELVKEISQEVQSLRFKVKGRSKAEHGKIARDHLLGVLRKRGKVR